MIDVLVVEDSLTVREYLFYILNAEPMIQVIGYAKDGQEAVEFVQRRRPHVIVMDINMPRMDGFEATRQIMATQPVPIILVSANWDPAEMSTSFKAMEAGAVAVLEKPRGIGHLDSERLGQELIRQVKLMNEVKVVTRWARKPSKSPLQQTPVQKVSGNTPAPRTDIRLIGIGTSTGGPPVLQNILTALSKRIPVPIVIVQHIARGFLPGMANWLEQSTGFPVRLATNDERLLPGHIYFAPDDAHLEVSRSGRARFNYDPPDKSLRPSVTHLFASLAQNYRAHAIGVLLTGMGDDGAAELKQMKDAGAVTIAQDKASSLVHGMPGEAIKLQAANYVLSPAEIVVTLEKLLNISP